jgi:multidrug efflux pump
LARSLLGAVRVPRCAVTVNPNLVNSYGISLETGAQELTVGKRKSRQRAVAGLLSHVDLSPTPISSSKPTNTSALIVAGHAGAPVRLRDIAEVADGVEDVRTSVSQTGMPSVILAVFAKPAAPT